VNLESKPLSERLRRAGLRPTPQRLAIYQALAASREHPTATQLYEQLRGRLPTLSQATVYNTLQALVAAGLVHEVGEAGDGRSHYDADLTPHVNLICSRCHRIDDFFEAPLAEVDRLVNGRSGYEIHGARLAYYGLCPECQAELATA
jgi:Fur family peroxide stress response transcriptional regulator